MCILVWSLYGWQCGRAGPTNGAATKLQQGAFRSVSKHFEALQIGRTAPAIIAHNYPWRACRADFTTARGGQGSRTVKRRADDATLTAGTAVVTRIAAARRWSSCAWLPP